MYVKILLSNRSIFEDEIEKETEEQDLFENGLAR